MDFLDYVDDVNKRARHIWILKKRAKILEDLGYTHSSFCEKYGLNKSYFSRVINGKAHAGWSSIEKIEKAFKDAGA